MPAPLNQENDTAICPGDSAPVKVFFSTDSVIWSPGNSLTDSLIRDPLAYPQTTTQYHIQLVDSSNCEFRDTLEVIVYDTPQVNICPPGSTQLCQNTSVQLTLNDAFSQYTWSNQKKASILNVTAPGQYYVDVVDQNGCKARSDTTTVTSVSRQYFEKTFGWTNDEDARATVPAMDGGMLMVGGTQSFGNGNQDIYVVKLNCEGNVEWSGTYGGTGNELGKSILRTYDCNYAITGYTTSFGSGQEDIFILKTDSEGNLEFANTYGGSDNENGFDLKYNDKNKSYIIAGRSWSLMWTVREM